MALFCPIRKLVSDEICQTLSDELDVNKDTIRNVFMHEDILEKINDNSDLLKDKDALKKLVEDKLLFEGTKRSVPEELYNDAKFFFDYSTENGKIEILEDDDWAVKFLEDGYQLFGKNNIQMYKSADGKKTLLRFAEPIKGETIQAEEKQEGEEVSAFEEAQNIMSTLRARNDERMGIYKGVEYVKETDLTVTDLANGRTDKSQREPLDENATPAITIGNTGDIVFKHFFSGKLEESYPNLTQKQLQNLILDLQLLKQRFDAMFGGSENYKVYVEPKDVAVAGMVNINGKNKSIAGIPDIIICDKEGNFYIFDLKTTMQKDAAKSLNTETYQKQLLYYATLLEKEFPELEGKIKIGGLIALHTNYPSPYKTTVRYVNDDDGNLYWWDEKSESDERKDIVDNSVYSGIRIDQNEMFVETSSIELDYDMSPMEMKVKEKKGNETVNTEEQKIDYNEEERQNEQDAEEYYESLNVTPADRHQISTDLMKFTSELISQLMEDEEWFHEEFADFENVDISNMSRKEFINLVGFDRLFEYAISLDFVAGDSESMKWVNVNRKFIKEEGFQTLIEIEDCAVTAKSADSVIYDGVNSETENEVEDMETNEREYWTVNFRNVSSKAGLSKLVRRELSMMHDYQLDENGDLEKKVSKFGLYEFVDGNMAHNTLKMWLSKCTTIDEMIDVLKQKLPQNLWLVDLVGYETIDENENVTKVRDGLLDKEGNFRQQFFVNMRSNETKYSIIKVSFDTDGNRVFRTHVVNMKPLAKILLDDVIFNIQNGSEKIVEDKTGNEVYFDRKVLEKIAEEYNRIKVMYNRVGIRNQQKFFKENKDRIATIYNLLGIKVSPDEIADAFTIKRDSKKRNADNTTFGKSLNRIDGLLNKLSDHKNSYDAYDPFEKGGSDNLYFYYKDLIEPFTDVLKTTIEASSYENGKTYYSFQPPSEIMNIFENLRNERGLETESDKGRSEFAQFLFDKYGKSSWFFDEETGKYKVKWLQLAGSQKCHTDGLFEHFVQIHFNGKDYKDLNPIELNLAHIAQYFADYWDISRHYNPQADRDREKKNGNAYGDDRAKDQYNKGAKTAIYHIPIFSDKNSNEYVRFYRYGNDTITDGFYNIVLQEIQRIRLVLDRAIEDVEVKREEFDLPKSVIDKNKDLFKRLRESKTYDEETGATMFDLSIDDFKKIIGNGAMFHFTPELNQEIIENTELGQLLLDKINGEPIEESDEKSDFVVKTKTFIKDTFNKYVEEELKHFEDIGMFEEQNRRFKVGLIDRDEPSVKENWIEIPYFLHLNGLVIESPAKYFMAAIKNISKRDGHKIRFVDEIYDDNNEIRQDILEEYKELMLSDIRHRLGDYVRNSVFATANIIQISAVDLAYFSSAESFQKRFAAWHSPGIRPEVSATFDDNGHTRKYSADGRCRIMHINDEISPSTIKEDVRHIFERRAKEIEDPIERRDFEIIAESIVNMFDKIDETDGQGYSSLTGFKKKMGMFGRWGKEKEAVYKRIKDGSYTTEDLEVFSELLKPHICANLLKANDSSIMSNSYVPTEIKDSEYLLILADALMRSEKKNTKLTALFDFMEETAFDDDEYNGVGIDSVTFNSTQKFGGEGVIDISDSAIDKYMAEHGINDRYKAIKDMLREKVYYDVDFTDVDFYENDNSRYDKRYVSEFSFEHFALLQEVPNHMVDHRQSEGSQVRILKITDINPDGDFYVGDEKIKGKQLQDETQRLTADLIEEAMDKLAKEFKVDAENPLVRKRKLSKILLENILKDQRFDRDLLEAVRINPNTNDFNIPLGDPIQAERVQNLIYSIIKKKINKIEVTGGPTVQVSPFGLSDNLNIVFRRRNGEPLMTYSQYKAANKITDDNVARREFFKYLGNDFELDSFECYCTCPSEKLRNHLVQMSKKNKKDYFHDLDLAIKDGIIPADKLKTIGYRIPTEGKYSIIPMKIKGFLPGFAGDAVIMPKEITLLTGADFDIDKMYMMFKRYELVGNKHYNEDFYNLTDEQLKQAWDDFYTKTEQGKAFVEQIEKTKENAFKQWVVSNTIQYGKFKGFNEDALKDLFEEEARKQGLNRNYKWVEGVQEAFREWLSENKDNYTEDITEVEAPHFEEYKGESKRNRLFDLHWAAATNRDMLIQLFTPGNFDNYKKMSCIMQILNADDGNEIDYEKYVELSKKSLDELDKLAHANGKPYLLPSTQEYFHKQNMIAKKMIGIFANNNVSHGFLQMQDIKLNLGDTKDGIPISFMFDGKILQSGDKLDEIYARDGITLISSVLASSIQASVDAVKFPTLENNNINTVTAPVINFMIRMGFDFEAIMLFINQPIIIELNKIYQSENMKGYQSVDDIINYMCKQMTLEKGDRQIKDFGNIDTKLEDDKLTELDKDVYETDFSREAFINNRNYDSEDNVIFQLKCLKFFKTLNSIGQQLNQMTFLTKYNSVTNAAGPTDSYTTIMLNREKQFYKLFEDSKNYFSDEAKDIIKNSPILKAFYESTVGQNGAANKIMGDFFFGMSDEFISLVDRLSKQIPSMIDVKTLNQFKNDALLFKLTKSLESDSPVFEMSETRRAYLVDNLPEKVKEITMRLANEGRENLLLSRLTYKKIRKDVEVINLRTGQYDSFELERMKDAWVELLNDEDEEVQEVALELMEYNLMRSSFGFNPETFLNATSVKVKKAYPGYVEAMQDPIYNNGIFAIYGNDFIKLFMRNHHNNSKIVPVLRPADAKVEEFDDAIEITIEKNKLKPKIVLGNKVDDLESYSPIIKYKGKLYEIQRVDDINDEEYLLTYNLTTPLGMKNNFVEYDCETDYNQFESVFFNGYDKTGIDEESDETTYDGDDDAFSTRNVEDMSENDSQSDERVDDGITVEQLVEEYNSIDDKTRDAFESAFKDERIKQRLQGENIKTAEAYRNLINKVTNNIIRGKSSDEVKKASQEIKDKFCN